MRVTMIGSCFSGFLKNSFTALADSGNYPCVWPIEFETATVWQRVDAIVDIIHNNVPDRCVIEYYLDRGHWNIQSHSPSNFSEWFTREILAQGDKARELVLNRPDLLIFDSLTDWRHSLYRNKKYGWKCFMGKLHFDQPEVEEKFNAEFEFIELLPLSSVNSCIKTIMRYFQSKNSNLKTVYVHFPATPEYLEEKWIVRAKALQDMVFRLTQQLDPKVFLQLSIPAEKVIPITDASHQNYSWQIWNHFHDEAYDYCAKRILDWYSENGE
jgi:hypothetical protein